MKQISIIFIFCFCWVLNSKAQQNTRPTTLREILDYSKFTKKPVESLSSLLQFDSLFTLIEEKYDLNGVKIKNVFLNENDSLKNAFFLDFIRPISSNVDHLFVRDNKLYDLTQFDNLQELYLECQRDVFIENPSIQKLQSVKYLSLRLNYPQKKVIIDKSHVIFSLKNLTSISLEISPHSEMLEIDYNDLSVFEKLSVLHIEDEELNVIPESWAKLKSLKSIYLNCTILDNSLNTIFQLPNVSSLMIGSFGVCPSFDIKQLSINMSSRKNKDYPNNFTFSLHPIHEYNPISHYNKRKLLKNFRKLKRKLARIENDNLEIMVIKSSKRKDY